MLRDKVIIPARLLELYDQIEPHLYKYPAIEPNAFRDKVSRVIAGGSSPEAAENQD